MRRSTNAAFFGCDREQADRLAIVAMKTPSAVSRDRRGGRASCKRVQKTAAMLKDRTLTGNRIVPEGHAKSPELMPGKNAIGFSSVRRRVLGSSLSPSLVRGLCRVDGRKIPCMFQGVQ